MLNPQLIAERAQSVRASIARLRTLATLSREEFQAAPAIGLQPGRLVAGLVGGRDAAGPGAPRNHADELDGVARGSTELVHLPGGNERHATGLERRIARIAPGGAAPGHDEHLVLPGMLVPLGIHPLVQVEKTHLEVGSSLLF